MTNEGQQEQYTWGYNSGIVQNFASRTAAKEAAFFLPNLKSGMNLLDCGCGQGNITMGLAEAVSPGNVTGIDVGEPSIERARAAANDNGVTNVEFHVGSVYELPFPDGSFDAVFTHAMLEHLTEPMKALSEMNRVLKSGGVIGIREIDQDGMIWYPPEPLFEIDNEVMCKVWQANGGDPFIGRRSKALLREAGFENIQTSSSCGGRSPENQARAADRYYGSEWADRIVELGIADSETLRKIGDARQKFAEHPDAFISITWCEAVGWKP